MTVHVVASGAAILLTPTPPRAPVRLAGTSLGDLRGPGVRAGCRPDTPGLRTADKLVISGERWSHGAARFAHLAGFAGLHHLTIRKLERLDLDETRIETLKLEVQGSVTLTRTPPTLRRLLVSRTTQLALSNIGDSQIEQLVLLDVGAFDCAQLASCHQLRHLDLRLPPGRVQNMHKLNDLPIEQLVIPDNTDASDLVGHPTLRRLSVYRRYGQVDLHSNIPEELLPITTRADQIYECELI